jgi:hypothetical protein
MTHTASETFIPMSIDIVGKRSVVRWIERPPTLPAAPFFSQLVRTLFASGARQRVTPLDALLTVEGRDPVGLVMHMSRCGSTLLMQCLATAGCVTPVSEATPVNQLLSRSDLTDDERVPLLRGLIRALGARCSVHSGDDASGELPPLIKLTSWNVLFFDIVRTAFPETPWLFLYRDSVEMLASHAHRAARWLGNDEFLASLSRVNRLPAVDGLAGEQRCAALLAAYGRAALHASPKASNFLNYNQLPSALMTDVPARFGLAPSMMQRDRIADASRIYSKDASRQRVFDPLAERRTRPVTDAVREADLQYTRSVYDALELRRLDGLR